MNQNDIDLLRDLDLAVAIQVMGWQSSGALYAPHYSTDLNSCRLAEAEVEQQGWGTAYGTEVARMLKASRILWSDIRDFDMLHVDAKTRCQAMLAVIQKGKV